MSEKTALITGVTGPGIAYPIWLLAFTQFLFVSLAFMKRDIELGGLAPETEGLPGRGYRASDRSILGSMGVTSGFMSVLVFGL